jgi:hypothetical protein
MAAKSDMRRNFSVLAALAWATITTTAYAMYNLDYYAGKLATFVSFALRRL